MKRWHSLALSSILLVFGIGMGMIVGSPQSEANSNTDCLAAIKFAQDEMTASGEFALLISQFMAAEANGDQAAMQVAVDGLGPVNARGAEAMKGFVSAATDCQ